MEMLSIGTVFGIMLSVILHAKFADTSYPIIAAWLSGMMFSLPAWAVYRLGRFMAIGR